MKNLTLLQKVAMVATMITVLVFGGSAFFNWQAKQQESLKLKEFCLEFEALNSSWVQLDPIAIGDAIQEIRKRELSPREAFKVVNLVGAQTNLGLSEQLILASKGAPEDVVSRVETLKSDFESLVILLASRAGMGTSPLASGDLEMNNLKGTLERIQSASTQRQNIAFTCATR